MSKATRTIPFSSSQVSLFETALNRAIADGFAPYEGQAPDTPYLSTAEAARRLGLSPQALAELIAANRIRQNPSLFNEKDPHHELRRVWLDAGFETTGDKHVRHKILVLSDEIKKLKKLLQNADRDEISAETVRTEIYGLKATPAQIPTKLLTPKLGKGVPGIPMINASDWHYAEVIDPAELGGYNAFNMDEADRRIEVFGEKTIEAARYYNPKMNYPGLVVCFSGDLFSGDVLHPEISQTNEAQIIDAFARLQGRTISFLRQLADAFPIVYAYCVVGNHGRTTPKPQSKLVTATNYEYLFYNQLELFFANDPQYKKRVLFNIPREIGVHFTIGADPSHNFPGHRYYLMHGDRMGAKGGRGVIGMIGPIVRGAKNVQLIEAKRGRPFDTLVIGHFHDYNILPGVLVNGTLKGIDEYALHTIGATPKPPSQAFWFNHKRYAPVIHQQLILAETELPHGNDAASPALRPKRKGPKLAYAA